MPVSPVATVGLKVQSAGNLVCMATEHSLKVLIADDHAVVRKGLRDLLREHWSEVNVTEASDGTSALERLRAEQWDLAILDITMPGMNGLEVLRQARRVWPELCAVILSMHSSPVYVNQSLKAGASGYLSKESAPEEMIAAVEAVLAGQVYVSRELKDPDGSAPRAG
jgi:DNA-binding NarL/FixJ family response regulator